MKLSNDDLDILFKEARTHRFFENREIPDSLLAEIYDALKMAPTSMNCLPGRFVFIKSPDAKKRLLPHAAQGNVKKIESAAVTVIIAGDTCFYDYMPRLFPHADLTTYYQINPEAAEHVITQNTYLQAAYLILAARALGLDCGPMSGFDNAGVDKEFFPDGKFKSYLLCNLGYGDKTTLYPRDERLGFDEACSIL
jgi:3-hydroxypropanoate dehydrogenase